MKTIEERISKVEGEIATAKKHRDQHKKRIKIVRSYKGDASTHEMALRATKDGIKASEMERDALEQSRTEKDKEE